MDEKGSSKAANETVMGETARPRLKEGMVPPDTGIYLRVEEGMGTGRIITVSAGGVYVIGREGADIVLDDVKASRKHAEIGFYGPGAYVIRDLASTNGTFLNSRRVSEKAKLANNDLIRIGETLLRLTVVEDSIPLSR